MATGYGPALEVRFPTEAKDFVYITAPLPALGLTQPAILFVQGGYSGKMPEANQSPASSYEVMNGPTLSRFPHTFS
jgi:hypothetical protein